jgi:ATP-dependent protease ClpP protease subunit
MWLSPVAAATGEYDLMVHGDIGESLSGESVSAKNVVAQLRKLPTNTKQINIRVNTFGGSVADGLAIYNALREIKARKVTLIDGVAISAGSLIAMAGDEIRAPKTALMMIHGPWTVAQGNASEMRQQADVLDKWADAMVSAYARKMTKRPKKVAAAIDFSPPEGVRAECARGLQWYKEGHGGDGLVSATVEWARKLAAGQNITPDKVRKMKAWLARHAVDLEAEGAKPGEDGYPSPGRVAWALWGGDPAVGWSNKLVRALDAEENNAQASFSEEAEKIRAMLKDGVDHWFTAEEALEAGFIDALIDEDLPEHTKALLARTPVALHATAMAAFSRAMQIAPHTKEITVPIEEQTPPEAAVETAPEAAVETAPEAAVETAPEAAVETAPEAAVETAPEAAVETAVETASSDVSVEAAAVPVIEAKVDVETIRAQIAAEFQAKLAAVEAEKGAIQARLAQEIEAKEVRAAVAEVASVYGAIPGKAEEIGAALRTLRKVAPDAISVIEASLKSANGLLAQLIEPRGVTRAEGLSPEQEVDRLAREIMAASGKNLTIEQARTKVYTDNPKMLAAVRGEDEV